MNETAIFELRKVSKTYKLGSIAVPALQRISLKFISGDFIAIAGPSGSGKTTLLNILGCLDVPTEGDVIIDNQLIIQRLENEKVRVRRHKIGFIFQSFNLIPVFNVYENVEYPLLLLKKPVQERRKLVEQALKEVGLQDRTKHLPQNLSGGEQQRVSIARALVKRPKLILADEPTANLDSGTGIKIIDLMLKVNQDEKITFVFSTHDSEILKAVKRIVKIRDGKISEEAVHA